MSGRDVTFGLRLAVVANGMEADVICGLLRVEGIACNHRQTDIAVAAWDATGPGGHREILVPADDLERARELLDAKPA